MLINTPLERTKLFELVSYKYRMLTIDSDPDKPQKI